MARNKRRIEREIIARIKTAFSNPDYNIPTAEETSRIREILALDHRNEDDWVIIKNILSSRCLICMESSVTDEKIRSVDHILAYNDCLLSFLDIDRATSYMKELKPEGVHFIQYNFGTIPFFDACEIADREEMELYIDPPVKDRIDDKFMSYHDGQLTAVMGVKPTFEDFMRRMNLGGGL